MGALPYSGWEGRGSEKARPIHVHQRVAVFVDELNMYWSAKSMYQKKVNYQALLEKIASGRSLVRATAYIIRTAETDQSQFVHLLHQAGYEVKIKDLRKFPDGTAKGDWDMGLAIDAISMADRVDVIALASGDGDFCDLVRHLKARGVRVEVYAFMGTAAEDLRLTATEFSPLDSEVLRYS
jgi:uncharacterized LabA/DUF88 family protein